jgi:hypothetical protein
MARGDRDELLQKQIYTGHDISYSPSGEFTAWLPVPGQPDKKYSYGYH